MRYQLRYVRTILRSNENPSRPAHGRANQVINRVSAIAAAAMM